VREVETVDSDEESEESEEDEGRMSEEGGGDHDDGGEGEGDEERREGDEEEDVGADDGMHDVANEGDRPSDPGAKHAECIGGDEDYEDSVQNGDDFDDGVDVDASGEWAAVQLAASRPPVRVTKAWATLLNGYATKNTTLFVVGTYKIGKEKVMTVVASRPPSSPSPPPPPPPPPPP
jgi:hypothetical protein